MDILRGHAMTNPNSLVLDIVQFTDDERFLELNQDGKDKFCRVLEDVVAGRRDVNERLRRRRAEPLSPARHAAIPRRLSISTTSLRQRYTVLEINTDDSLGLLYRISRTISQAGCDVDLVLISTEGHRAIDVFHITQAGAKLAEAAQQTLSGDLQRMLQGDEGI